MQEIEYFAYGSNMNLHQMDFRCPGAQRMGKVVLKDHALAFRCGVLTILPCEGSSVEGVMWRVNQKDERTLDRYEGAPRMYAKETVTVQDTHAANHSVLVYIMNSPYKDEVVPPRREYLNGVLEGCRQNGIEQQPVCNAADDAMSVLPMQSARKQDRRKRDKSINR